MVREGQKRSESVWRSLSIGHKCRNMCPEPGVAHHRATLTAALICHSVTHQECQHITTPTMATVATHPRLSLTRTSNSGSQIHTTWACLGLKTRLRILLQNSAVVWG